MMMMHHHRPQVDGDYGAAISSCDCSAGLIRRQRRSRAFHRVLIRHYRSSIRPIRRRPPPRFIFVMQKMKVVNLLANLSVRDWPWRLCNLSFVDASSIYVVEQEQSFQISHWTLSGSDFKVIGDTLYDAHQKVAGYSQPHPECC